MSYSLQVLIQAIQKDGVPAPLPRQARRAGRSLLMVLSVFIFTHFCPAGPGRSAGCDGAQNLRLLEPL